jgi:hypothetical protein
MYDIICCTAGSVILFGVLAIDWWKGKKVIFRNFVPQSTREDETAESGKTSDVVGEIAEVATDVEVAKAATGVGVAEAVTGETEKTDVEKAVSHSTDDV